MAIDQLDNIKTDIDRTKVLQESNKRLSQKKEEDKKECSSKSNQWIIIHIPIIPFIAITRIVTLLMPPFFVIHV